MILKNKFIRYLLVLAIGLNSCKPEETVSPRRKTIQDAVFASGQVVQEEEYSISATVDGIIRELYFREGDSVTENQLLVKVKSDIQNNQLDELQAVYNEALQNSSDQSPLLAQLNLQIAQGELQLKQDENNYLRFKKLREQNSVSQLDYEKAKLQYEASGTNLELLKKNYAELKSELQLNLERSRYQLKSQQAALDEYNIKAEKPGLAVSLLKKTGELVRKGELIGKIGSGPYILKLYVAEEDIARVKTGQKVAVHLNTCPDQNFPATVIRILPGFDPAEQSYIVEARLDQQPERLFPGTQLQANIDTGTRENVMAIPTAFLEKGKYVTLKNGETKMIETGSKNREWTEVISGLKETDILIRPKK